MVGDEAIGARENLLLASGRIEADQSVGGCDVDGAIFGIGQDAVHAEHVLVFDVSRGPVIGLQPVEAAVEISDPETAVAVRRPAPRHCGRSTPPRPAARQAASRNREPSCDKDRSRVSANTASPIAEQLMDFAELLTSHSAGEPELGRRPSSGMAITP